MRNLTLHFINQFRIHYKKELVYSHLHPFEYLSINVVLCLDSSIFINDNSDSVQQVQSKHEFDKSEKLFRSRNTSLLILHSTTLQYIFTLFKCEKYPLWASSCPRDIGWISLPYYTLRVLVIWPSMAFDIPMSCSLNSSLRQLPRDNHTKTLGMLKHTKWTEWHWTQHGNVISVHLELSD
jgi:hypothetical protein